MQRLWPSSFSISTQIVLCVFSGHWHWHSFICYPCSNCLFGPHSPSFTSVSPPPKPSSFGWNNFDIDILLTFWLNENLDPNLCRPFRASQVVCCLSLTFPYRFTDKVIFKSTLIFWMIAVSHFISLPDWLDLVGHNCTYYFNTLQFGHFLWGQSHILHSCLQYFITVLSQTLWRTHFSQN